MRTLVVAPHPDDEVLGVGGTLLRRKSEGAVIGWLIVTGISTDFGWTEESVRLRNSKIEKITEIFSFDEVYKLGFPTTKLDTLPMGDLISKISSCIKTFEPEELFIPHSCDVHSDHRIVFDSVVSCTKWFRYPFVKRILAYETLSETDFSISFIKSFNPNVFIDISKHLETKLKAMDVYESELGNFPFPRSHKAIVALANTRGASSGYIAAEAFELLRERC